MKNTSFTLFITSIALLLVSVSLTAFVIYKQEQVGAEVRAKMVDLKIWNDLTNAEGSLASKTADEAGSRSRLRALVLLSESDTITFLSTVEDTAKALGVSVTTLDLKEEKIPDPHFNELSASFSLQGEGEAVERVLKLFELLPYRSYIESLTLDRGLGITKATVGLRVSTIK
ncbi:hypothetical protein H6789_02400 [Candidatus Nomurabacteria bacterium]|nr:hypothetical protein [Candidatus Nomurabacteria bacterium]